MTKPFFSLNDSEFNAAISTRMNQRSSVEVIISAVLYFNLVSALAIALAVNGLSINAATLYFFLAFSFIFLSILSELFIKPRSVSVALASFLEAAAILVSLLINLLSDYKAPPSILVISICMVTFLSLPISIRSFIYLFISKGLIILSCIVYIYFAENNSIKFVYLIFPLIIVFFIFLAISYWLYIREVKLHHQEIKANVLKNMLDKKHHSLKKAQTKLSKEHQLRDKLIRHIGHDLRQPINTLSYALFNLQKVPDIHSQAEHLDIANKSIDTANYFIEDILQISTYQKNDIDVSIEPFVVQDLFDLLRREYQSIVEVRGIKLTIVPCSVSLHSDIRLISRIIRNFLSNAIRHSQTQRILIGARRNTQSLSMQVIDQGVGIAAQGEHALFEEFSQFNPPKDSAGFGLGLSIAKNLAAVCGATVTVKTAVGKGTLCSVNIPYVSPKI